MANLKLTDKIIDALPLPAKGSKRYPDAKTPNFGVVVTEYGKRSFYLRYRNSRDVDRQYKIGNRPEWTTSAAREEAERIKRAVDLGDDPVADQKELREAPTVADMCQRYDAEHLPNKRSAKDDRLMINKDILPALGGKKVADITFSDMDTLHRNKARQAPVKANRVIALLSKMFSLAIRWGWRSDNPCKGVQRSPEEPRHVYLSTQELERLTSTLATFRDQQAANIVRLLLLTGARRGEVLSMKWADLDLDNGVWVKPGATTKRKTQHRVPLSVAAQQLLAGLKLASKGSEHVFASHGKLGRRESIKDVWPEICEAAGIRDVRVHDLRHTYASVLASAGLSLPVIGALLGHTQTQTTLRYSHLFDDPLRQATERVAAVVTGKPKAEVIPLKDRA
jgi:integrase